MYLASSLVGIGNCLSEEIINFGSSSMMGCGSNKRGVKIPNRSKFDEDSNRIPGFVIW